MNFSKYEPRPADALFIKNIMVFDEPEQKGHTILPFFADGYPGLLFHITPKGQWVQPHNKQMPTTYLYGQTLTPIELRMKGAYKIIVLQLYPFVLNSFFNLKSRDLNNECFNLLNLEGWATIEKELLATRNSTKQIEWIVQFLQTIFVTKKHQLDQLVVDALRMILNSRSPVTVSAMSEQLYVTVRTLERRFLKETGISVKDFIQITRFQRSLEQMMEKDYRKLSDIVYANGYADQSHFIRVFKAFTGKTPKHFTK